MLNVAYERSQPSWNTHAGTASPRFVCQTDKIIGAKVATGAVAGGISDWLWDMADTVALIGAMAEAPKAAVPTNPCAEAPI